MMLYEVLQVFASILVTLSLELLALCTSTFLDKDHKVMNAKSPQALDTSLACPIYGRRTIQIF